MRRIRRNTELAQQLARYANLLVKVGANLQPGQPLRIGAELPQAEFVRILSAAAYQAGARYVHVDWLDTPTVKARMQQSQPEYLDFFPEYEVARHRQMVDEKWARIALVGEAFPDLFDDVDPTVIRQISLASAQKLKFYREATMSNQMQWCVAAVPTPAWAKKLYPHLTMAAAMRQLWQIIFKLVRLDQPNPTEAWMQHNAKLKSFSDLMQRQQFTAVRFFDPLLDKEGQPATNLTVGMTEAPVWLAASAETPDGVEFFPNMPTEELFSTPHNQRTEGWVRTSKPSFPLGRRVESAWFRFKEGEVVEFRAKQGMEVLEQFFQIPGSKRLGEVALVDVRSPVNQSSVLFYDTLLDENAVSHIAFGKAYPDGMKGGTAMSDEERAAAGINLSDTHIDFMIGTATMNVYGVRQDGTEVLIMENGRWVEGN